jgi:hypothetical protein
VQGFAIRAVLCPVSNPKKIPGALRARRSLPWNGPKSGNKPDGKPEATPATEFRIQPARNKLVYSRDGFPRSDGV